MNAHKLAIKYLKENIAITDKFHKELVAERAVSTLDPGILDFMIKDIQNRQNYLLEALSEALHCVVDEDPATIINPEG